LTLRRKAREVARTRPLITTEESDLIPEVARRNYLRLSRTATQRRPERVLRRPVLPVTRKRSTNGQLEIDPPDQLDGEDIGEGFVLVHEVEERGERPWVRVVVLDGVVDEGKADSGVLILLEEMISRGENEGKREKRTASLSAALASCAPAGSFNSVMIVRVTTAGEASMSFPVVSSTLPDAGRVRTSVHEASEERESKTHCLQNRSRRRIGGRCRCKPQPC
jgi:hypothetical protein